MSLATNLGVRAFGPAAQVWAQRLTDERPLTVTEPQTLGIAFVDVVEARRAGSSRSAAVLFEHPRRMLLRAIAAELTNGLSHDVFLNNLKAFANGQVAINGQPQAAAEASFFGPAVSKAFDDLAVVSDATHFRSNYELEAATAMLGNRPQRVSIVAPPDPRVPSPLEASAADASIVLWADGIDDALVSIAGRLASEIRIETIVVRDVPISGFRCVTRAESAPFLANARLIVSLSDDPGTAISLAAFTRPLAVATHGAREYLDCVQTFDIWDPLRVVDAMLQALAGPPPRLRLRASFSPTDHGTPTVPQSAPLVSIVMAVYDRLENLKSNLERLQRQTYPNIEIIVVSNNGPDASHICDAFPNVRYVHRDHNTGEAGQPRNDGIALARGEFVTALDDDDVYLDDHIARMVAACSSGLDVVYSNFLIQIVEPQADGSETLLGYDIEKSTAITPIELLVMNRLGYMTVFARKSVYERFGAYALDFTGGSEVELWLRMGSNTAMGHVEQPTTVYTIRKNWHGSLTAPNHSLFIAGYEELYRAHPAAEMALIQTSRAQHLAALRSGGATAREPRYAVAHRSV